MILFFMIIFTLLGLIGLINSAYIFLNNKSFIYLPQFYKKNKSVDTLKYQAYTQIVLGLLFIFYGIVIFHFNITSLLLHILFIIITLVFIIILGHINLN